MPRGRKPKLVGDSVFKASSDESGFETTKSPNISTLTKRAGSGKRNKPNVRDTSLETSSSNIGTKKAEKPVDGRDEMAFLTSTAAEEIVQMFDVANGENVPIKLKGFQIYDENDNLCSLDAINFPSGEFQPGETEFRLCGTAYGAHLDDSAGALSLISDVIITANPWIFGFGEDDKLTVGVSSMNFDFYLSEPHPVYGQQFQHFMYKCSIVKRVTDFLIKSIGNQRVTLADLIAYLENFTDEIGVIDTDTLIEHGDFIWGHLHGYDSARDEEEPTILNNFCVRKFCKLANIDCVITKRRRHMHKEEKSLRGRKATIKKEPMLAYATDTVMDIFEKPLGHVIEGSDENKAPNKGFKTRKRKSRAEEDSDYCEDSEESDDDVEKESLKKPRVEDTDDEAKISSDDSVVQYKGQTYRCGDGVYIPKGFVHFDYKRKAASALTEESELYDEKLYPEKYRKNLVGERPFKCPKPYCIGRIIDVYNKKGNVYADVRIFYRPEDTSITKEEAQDRDLNLVHFSTEVVQKMKFSLIAGRCAVLSAVSLTKKMDLDTYFRTGQDRFYYDEMFDAKTHLFTDSIPHTADGQAAQKRLDEILKLTAIPSIAKPLRTLDLFAGCGGMSKGMEEAGVADVRYAVEANADACEAFQLNHPSAIVYHEDCNALLKRVVDKKGDYPKIGDVELIIGGPPCQGFCTMNRFNKGVASQIKNSCVVTFLSFVEVYQPRYVIMENVRSFRSFRQAGVYNATVTCFRKLGYQVIDDILQAGHYGVPQSRHRFILIAARNGERMPSFPRPLHCFSSYYTSSSSESNDLGAPLRMITVRDGICDLEKVSDLTKIIECTPTAKYLAKPATHFQRLMRQDSKILLDHMPKAISDLNQARINNIPLNGDWRDLPNIVVDLPNGKTKVLKYIVGTKMVCQCQVQKSIKKANPCKVHAQKETLIPWCLPHTADRHCNWAGLYGRLDYDAHFRTTVTNPEPMAKQGRVIHPNQNRVVTVREAARSQGFKDTFKFYGSSLLKRYQQVGNAVPPPLSYALGIELLRALADEQS